MLQCPLLNFAITQNQPENNNNNNTIIPSSLSPSLSLTPSILLRYLMSCSPTDEYRLLLVNEYTIEENWWQLGLKKLVKLRINLKKEKNVFPHSLPPSLSLLLCASTLFSEGHSNKVWMLLKNYKNHNHLQDNHCRGDGYHGNRYQSNHSHGNAPCLTCKSDKMRFHFQETYSFGLDNTNVSRMCD